MLGLAACSRTAPVVDQSRQVVVITDDKTDLELPLRSLLERGGPASEPGLEFKLRFESLENLERVSKTRTLLIIGTMNDDPIRALIGNALKDTFALFQLKDHWVKDQLVLILVAQNEGNLVPALEHYGARIIYTLRGDFLARLRALTYNQGYNKQLSAELKKNYGFSFEVPFGFTPVKTDTTRHFISLVARNPERKIFVYWQSRIPSGLNLTALRDSLTGQFYNGDTIERDAVAAETTKFLDSSAVFISGIWQTAQAVIGGPFISYGFNYGTRFYYIDGALSSPDISRLDYIKQLEIILETFKP